MTDVSRETLDRLQVYEALVRRWSKKINLISKNSAGSVWERHILDCLQLAAFAKPSECWCDLGSGAGFPGLVVSIARPDVEMVLIESDQRKAVFLQHVVRELRLHATVIASRIEAAEPVAAHVVSARALASLDTLLAFSARHGTERGRHLFPKGTHYREEIATARERWSFDVDVHPSAVEKSGVILQVENIARV